MTSLYKISVIRIRLSILYSLIFFAFTLHSCRQKPGNTQPILLFDKERAVGISIPVSWFDKYDNPSDLSALKVRLKGSGGDFMLGEFKKVHQSVVFYPLIALSPNREYTIYHGNKLISTLKVPGVKASPPHVAAVYPALAELPENLLKVYIHFSKPMAEGRSSEFLVMHDDHGKVLPDVFLDLQPELWNAQGTVLTVWLDPGRIKRDLQPNLMKGNPLKAGNKYSIHVLNGWPDKEGLPLKTAADHYFMAGKRDNSMPDANSWKLSRPRTATNDPLIVVLDEPLDHFLLMEALTVTDASGKEVKGMVSIGDKDSKVYFKPQNDWQKGKYILHADPALEDLAGNNMNRPFDQDLTEQRKKSAVFREFEVQ